jgi:hypothetical protein
VAMKRRAILLNAMVGETSWTIGHNEWDGIASDKEGINGTTNGVAVSQQCRHWMCVRTNACKKLGSVFG